MYIDILQYEMYWLRWVGKQRITHVISKTKIKSVLVTVELLPFFSSSFFLYFANDGKIIRKMCIRYSHFLLLLYIAHVISMEQDSRQTFRKRRPNARNGESKKKTMCGKFGSIKVMCTIRMKKSTTHYTQYSVECMSTVIFFSSFFYIYTHPPINTYAYIRILGSLW